MLKTRSGLPKHCTYQLDRDGKRACASAAAASRAISPASRGPRLHAPVRGGARSRSAAARPVGVSLRSLPGSFSALCASYYGSPEFRRLKASTQRVRRNILERFRTEHGHRLLKDLQTRARTHHHRRQGEHAGSSEQSAEGSARRAQLRGREGMIASNPALGVKRYKKRGEGIHIWTEPSRAIPGASSGWQQSRAGARIVAQHRAAPQRRRQDGLATCRRRLHRRAAGEDRRAVADPDPSRLPLRWRRAEHQHDFLMTEFGGRSPRRVSATGSATAAMRPDCRNARRTVCAN